MIALSTATPAALGAGHLILLLPPRQRAVMTGVGAAEWLDWSRTNV